MTKMIYTVINRPKKDIAGRTNIGWHAEGEREEVSIGGFLETSRTLPGEVRRYHAVMIKGGVRTSVGNNHETRAQAAFAIWRSYYSDWRAERNSTKEQVLLAKEARAEERERIREYRATPEGQKAYRAELNRKAKVRRDSMTPEQKAEIYAKRRAKRAHKKEYG